MADLTNTLLANTKQYSDTLFHLAGQKNSKLEETVSKVSMTTKKEFFDRIGDVEFTPIISQNQDTPHNEIKYSRRALECSDSVFSTLIDERDISRSMINPQSDIIQRSLRAYNLQKDKVIIAAALGKAESIGKNDASSQVALPSDQIIVHGNSNLTTAKIKSGIEKFFAKDVDLSENKVCLAISPSMYQALLNQSEFINKDFRLTDGQTIDTSGVSEVLGVNVKIVSNKALLPLSASIRSAVMYTYDSIKFGIQAGIEQISIDKRPDKLNNTQILHKISLGAVRMEEEQVVAIQCNETA
tara:strand:- start:9077 stop:9973 length:897 start_codon:yes stop_codon:yes gene_type:complete